MSDWLTRQLDALAAQLTEHCDIEGLTFEVSLPEWSPECPLLVVRYTRGGGKKHMLFAVMCEASMEHTMYVPGRSARVKRPVFRTVPEVANLVYDRNTRWKGLQPAWHHITERLKQFIRGFDCGWDRHKKAVLERCYNVEEKGK